jgi:hypothetical protein
MQIVVQVRQFSFVLFSILARIMQGAASHRVGRRSVRRLEHSGELVFDSELHRLNQIGRTVTGDYYCLLCWKAPKDEWQVQSHLQSNQHRRRMFNQQSEVDPLACVPHPHLDFTEVVDGWAKCRICKKRMDESHWNSANHIKWLNYCISQSVTLSSVDASPPLPQPPPPPEPPRDGCALPSRSSADASQSQSSEVRPSVILSPAQFFRGGHEDGYVAATHVLRQSLPGRTASASNQSQSIVFDSCPSVSSQIMPLHLKLAAGMSSLVHASSSRFYQQHPWGSRGPSGEILNDDEWNESVQAFDKRYSQDWWSIEIKWNFLDL